MVWLRGNRNGISQYRRRRLCSHDPIRIDVIVTPIKSAASSASNECFSLASLDQSDEMQHFLHLGPVLRTFV